MLTEPIRYFQKDNASTEKFMKIQIPSTLKKQLVDDWEFITQQNKVLEFFIVWSTFHLFHLFTFISSFLSYVFFWKEFRFGSVKFDSLKNIFLQLVKLPRSPNVDEILKKYLEYRSKKDGM